MHRVLTAALAMGFFATTSFIGPANAQLLINKATVCFDNKGAKGLVRGHVAPIGCFSSSCTRVIERQVSLGVNSRTGEIRIATRFLLERTGAKICTADCGGGGRSTFDYRFFAPRVYKVIMGNKQVGTLDLRQANARKCFGGKP